MAAFRRVESARAGPGALGILIPPGPRTLVIVRPKTLEFDLLPALWTGDGKAPVFCQFARMEAAVVSRRLLAALEQAVAIGRCPVETFGDAQTFQVWLRTDELVWIACRRVLGQGYQPAVFATQVEAAAAGEALAPFVWPAADAELEVYFNTQLFS